MKNKLLSGGASGRHGFYGGAGGGGGMVAHAFGGALHTADTIANVQTKLSAGNFFTSAANEFGLVANKAVISNNDRFLIEDSANAGAKRYCLASAVATFVGGPFVNLQGATPGVQQVGNFNVDGVGVVGNRLGINAGSNLLSRLTISSDNLVDSISLENHFNNDAGLAVNFESTRGTRAAKLTNITGDYIASLKFVGAESPGFTLVCSQIKVQLEGVLGAGILPSNIQFWTQNSAGTNQEVLRMNSSAFVGVGTVSPATRFHVSEASVLSPRGIMSSQHSTDANGARVHLRKSRGSNTAPSIVVTGDMLGRLVASAYDGANYLEMAGIDINCSGTIAATRIPTEISFWTATNAAPSVLTKAMTINSSQYVGIGGAPSGTYRLSVSGDTVSNSFSTYYYYQFVGGFGFNALYTSTQPVIYNSGGGGAAPFNLLGNLFISPRAAASNPGSIYFYLGNPAVLHTAFVTGGNTGHGILVPTALIHLAAGTATASTAPLKFTSGVNLTNPEAGAVEFVADDLSFTITTGAARKTFVLTDGGPLINNRIPWSIFGGRVTTDNLLVYDGVAFRAPFVYGSMWANNATLPVSIVTPGTFVEITSGLSVGYTNSTPFAAGDELQISLPGKYLMHWSLSINSTVALHDLGGCIVVGGVVKTSTINRAFCVSGTTSYVSISGVAILDLLLNDIVRVGVTDYTGASFVNVLQLHCALIRVG